MGSSTSYSSPDIPGDAYIVSPYGADIDTTSTGTVRYSDSFFSLSSLISNVSSFIRSETGNSFYGTKMMVAEWDSVPLFDRRTVSCVHLSQSTVVLCI